MLDIYYEFYTSLIRVLDAKRDLNGKKPYGTVILIRKFVNLRGELMQALDMV